MSNFDYYDLWRDKFTTEELESSLGQNIASFPEEYILVELCEASQRYFYGRRFTVVKIETLLYQGANCFQIFIPSVDDSSLLMVWVSKNMELPPYKARELILSYLQKINYFVTIAGFEFFCKTMLGKPYIVDYN